MLELSVFKGFINPTFARDAFCGAENTRVEGDE
jgi:hypothetical protein